MKDNRSLLRAVAVVVWECRSKAIGFFLIGWLLLLPEVTGAQTIPVKERFSAGEEVQYELYFKWGILMPRVPDFRHVREGLLHARYDRLLFLA